MVKAGEQNWSSVHRHLPRLNIAWARRRSSPPSSGSLRGNRDATPQSDLAERTTVFRLRLKVPQRFQHPTACSRPSIDRLRTRLTLPSNPPIDNFTHLREPTRDTRNRTAQSTTYPTVEALKRRRLMADTNREARLTGTPASPIVDRDNGATFNATQRRIWTMEETSSHTILLSCGIW